jgi:hypothetical protein
MRSLACFSLVLAAACGGLAPASASADDLSGSAPRATVALIHGLGGFQHVEQIDYFYGVPELYRSLGAAVVIPGSSMFNTVEHRAAELKAQLDPVPGAPFGLGRRTARCTRRSSRAGPSSTPSGWRTTASFRRRRRTGANSRGP